MTIEPTAVYSPPRYTPPNAGQGGRYYVINQPPQPVNFPRRVWNSIPQQNPRATLPGQLPEFLRNGPMNNRAVVFNLWVIAMIVVGFDEWHNLGILPRPARLWDTSLVYGVLVMLGFVDAMVPIANALAIGFTFQLIWQYFQGNITPATNTAQGAGGVGSQVNQGVSAAITVGP